MMKVRSLSSPPLSLVAASECACSVNLNTECHKAENSKASACLRSPLSERQ